MTETMRVLALGGDVVRNAFLAKNDGGAHLDHGLATELNTTPSNVELAVTYDEYGGLGDLRTRLDAGTLESIYGSTPHVVVLDVSGEAEQLTNRAKDPRDAVAGFHDDLVAVFDAIKRDCGAHVLVVGVSSFDPGDPVSNFHGFSVEPIMLRAHRINLALFQTSHEVGLSVIDVDRLVAEAGGGKVVPGPLELSPEGSAMVRDETLRVLADYGFFDERTLVAQVGTRGERQ
jgi:hypothetical protein